LRGLVSVEGLSPIYKWTRPLSYDIVSRKFNKARIIVYTETLEENEYRVVARDKELLIYGFSEESNETYYLRIKLWFKIKNIELTHRNGILTINVKGKRFLFF
jgi:HSP20 family molecular chaperone IbpA